MIDFPALVRKPNVRLTGCVAVALALAWLNRFVLDDAFISFRYARNLAAGHGLVWNIGERVEGYTNFLWTVCLTPAWLLGINPVGYAYVLSLAALTVTLLASARLADNVWRSRQTGWLCVLLLAINYSFICYGTGGLETQFMTAWVMVAIGLLVWSNERPEGCVGGMAAAGVASACAVMTRMDAVLLLSPFWVWRVFAVWRHGSGRDWVAVCAGISAAALPLVAWLFWRHAYYGAWVPNTFLIKTGGVSWIRGLYYVGLFYLVYGFVLVGPLCLHGARRMFGTPKIACVLAAGLLWHTYVVLIGGDFMEFRTMVPVFPLVMVLLSGRILDMRGGLLMRVFMVGVLVACSVCHGVWARNYPGIQSIREMKECHDEWRSVARGLVRCLGGECTRVKIAVTAAGIIPYYTECPTLDLLGLNDRAVALEGERVEPVSRWLGNRPGHVRIADRGTVEARGVNLLLNMPWVMEAKLLDGLDARAVCEEWRLGRASDPQRVHAMRVRYAGVPDAALPTVIAWPLEDGRVLMTLYVCPSPVVDRAIVRCGARVIEGRR